MDTTTISEKLLKIRLWTLVIQSRNVFASLAQCESGTSARDVELKVRMQIET